MDNTKIEWCDATWSPVTGCMHGCPYCYAKKIAERFSGDREYNEAHALCGYVNVADDDEGKSELRELHAFMRTEDGNPVAYPFGFTPTLHGYRLGWPAEKKNGRNIFVCSMADLFGPWIPDEWISKVLNACRNAPQHQYMFLTKNPKRYAELPEFAALLDNFWFGTTITSSEDAFRAWQMPLARPNTFLSIEPLLGPIDPGVLNLNTVSWVIIGAETGNRRGKVAPEKEWVDEIVTACRKRRVPVFMKESLSPVMGEEGMIREMPERLRKEKTQ